MTLGTKDRTVEQDEGRATVAAILIELEAAWQTYGAVYRQIEVDGALDPGMRESSVQVIASVATTLRRLAPSLASTRALPDEERPDAALVLMRVLTDSLSVALAEHPAAELMVPPGDVDAVFRELQAFRPGDGAGG